jgi:hypothetical protein
MWVKDPPASMPGVQHDHEISLDVEQIPSLMRFACVEEMPHLKSKFRILGRKRATMW